MKVIQRKEVSDMNSALKNHKKSKSFFNRENKSKKRENFLSNAIGCFAASNVEYLYLTNHSGN